MEQTINTFSGGLQKDTNPMMQGKDTLTDALNATYITMNGNEVALQNDMGNRRVDNAFLPPGYEPVGIKEYGGIIYIASYNPITNKSQIGSFPSPLKRISSVDGEEDLKIGLDLSSMINTYKKTINNSNKQHNFLKSDFAINSYSDKYPLHIGDKFILYGDISSLYKLDKNRTWLSNFYNVSDGKINSPKNRLFTIDVGVLNSQNDFVELTKSLVRWDNDKMLDLQDNDNYKLNAGYFIKGTGETQFETVSDKIFEEARNQIDANTYQYKLSGPLSLKTKINHLQTFTLNVVPEYNKYDEISYKSGDWNFKVKNPKYTGDLILFKTHNSLTKSLKLNYDSVIFFTEETILNSLISSGEIEIGPSTPVLQGGLRRVPISEDIIDPSADLNSPDFGFSVSANSTKTIQLLFKIEDNKGTIIFVDLDNNLYRLEKQGETTDNFVIYNLVLQNNENSTKIFYFNQIKIYNESQDYEVESLNSKYSINSTGEYDDLQVVENYYKDFDVFDLYDENSEEPLKYYNKGVTISYDGTNYIASIKRVYLKLVEDKNSIYNFIALPKLINNNGNPFGESNCLGTAYEQGISGMLYLNVEAIIKYNSPDILSSDNDPIKLDMFYSGTDYRNEGTISRTYKVIKESVNNTLNNYYDNSYSIDIIDDLDLNIIYFKLPILTQVGDKILIDEGNTCTLELYDLQEKSVVSAPIEINDGGIITITQELYDSIYSGEDVVFKLTQGTLLSYSVSIFNYLGIYFYPVNTILQFGGSNIVIQLYDLDNNEFIGNSYTINNNELLLTQEILNLVTSENIVFKLVSGFIYNVRVINLNTFNIFSEDYTEMAFNFEDLKYTLYYLNIIFNYLVESNQQESIKSITYNYSNSLDYGKLIEYINGKYTVVFDNETIYNILHPQLNEEEILKGYKNFEISCSYGNSSSVSYKKYKTFSIYTLIQGEGRWEFVLDKNYFYYNNVVKIQTKDAVEAEVNYEFDIYNENGEVIIQGYESNTEFTQSQLSLIKKCSSISLYNKTFTRDINLLSKRNSEYYEEPIYLPGFERNFSLNIEKLNSGTVDVIEWRTFTQLSNDKKTTLKSTILAYPKQNEVYDKLYLVLTDPNWKNDTNEQEKALSDIDSSEFNTNYVTSVENLPYTRSETLSSNPILHIITLSENEFLLLDIELDISLIDQFSTYSDLLGIHPSRLYNVDLVWRVNKNGKYSYRKIDSYWIMTTTLFNKCYISGENFIDNYVFPTTKYYTNIRNELLNFKPSVTITTSNDSINNESSTVIQSALFKRVEEQQTNLENILTIETYNASYELNLNVVTDNNIYPNNIISTTGNTPIIEKIDKITFDKTDLNNKIVNRNGEDWSDCLEISQIKDDYIDREDGNKLKFKFKLCQKFKGDYKETTINRSFLPLSILKLDSMMSFDDNMRVIMDAKDGKLDNRRCKVTFLNRNGRPVANIDLQNDSEYLYPGTDGIKRGNPWDLESISFGFDNYPRWWGYNWSQWNTGFPLGCIRPETIENLPTFDSAGFVPNYNPRTSDWRYRGVLFDGGWNITNASFIWVKSEDEKTLYKVGLICKDNPSVCNFLLATKGNTDGTYYPNLTINDFRGKMSKSYGVINLDLGKEGGRMIDEYDGDFGKSSGRLYISKLNRDEYGFDVVSMNVGGLINEILRKIFILLIYGPNPDVLGPEIVYDLNNFRFTCERTYIQSPVEVTILTPNFNSYAKYINLTNGIDTSIFINSKINLHGKFVSKNNLGRINISINDEFDFNSQLGLSLNIGVDDNHQIKNIVETGFPNIIDVYYNYGTALYHSYIYYQDNNLNNPLGKSPISRWIRIDNYTGDNNELLSWNTIPNNLKISIDYEGFEGRHPEWKNLIYVYAQDNPHREPYYVNGNTGHQYRMRISLDRVSFFSDGTTPEQIYEDLAYYFFPDPDNKQLNYIWGIYIPITEHFSKMYSWGELSGKFGWL